MAVAFITWRCFASTSSAAICTWRFMQRSAVFWGSAHGSSALAKFVFSSLGLEA